MKAGSFAPDVGGAGWIYPQAKDMLDITGDHHTGLIVGFDRPEIAYARGVQKDRGRKIHRYTDKKK